MHFLIEDKIIKNVKMKWKLLKEISIKEVKSDAEGVFRIGDFYCSEAIISSVRKNRASEMPIEWVSTGSGFPVSIGRSKCMCGAVLGAIICLRYFSEEQPFQPPQTQKCMEFAYELQERLNSPLSKLESIV